MNDLSNKNVEKKKWLPSEMDPDITIRGGGGFRFFKEKKLYFKTICFERNKPDIKYIDV